MHYYRHFIISVSNHVPTYNGRFCSKRRLENEQQPQAYKAVPPWIDRTEVFELKSLRLVRFDDDVWLEGCGVRKLMGQNPLTNDMVDKRSCLHRSGELLTNERKLVGQAHLQHIRRHVKRCMHAMHVSICTYSVCASTNLLKESKGP